MKKAGYIILFLFVTTTSTAVAQDIHFSQFYASPLTLNPAMTGFFPEEYRLMAVYRNQWSSVATAYSTASVSADFNLIKGLFNNDNIGTGIMLFSDRQGSTQFNTTLAGVSLSYLKGIGGKNIIGFGGQASFGQIGFNPNAATFDRQINDVTIDPNLPSGERFLTTSIFYPDISAGFMWSFMPKEELSFYAGSSMAHLNAPDQSFMGDSEYLYVKTSFQAGSQVPLTKNAGLISNLIYLKQGPSSELNLGAMLKLKAQPKSRDKTAFYFGGWYRFQDAVIAVTRVDYKNMSFGLSYDMNVSQLSPGSRSRGATEFSIAYFGGIKSVKKKKGVRVRPTMYCPKF